MSPGVLVLARESIERKIIEAEQHATRYEALLAGALRHLAELRALASKLKASRV